MKVLYVLPRYHTNQIAIMKGWIRHGDDLKVLTWYTGKLEEHPAGEPDVLGYSKLFQMFLKLHIRLHPNDPYAKDINLRYGFPPLGKFAAFVREYKPDIVILRERSVYTMVCTRVCEKNSIPVFLYNQSPLWAEPSYFNKTDFMHRVVWSRCPQYRYTPVHQIGYDMEGKIKDQHAYFAPFVMEPGCSPSEKNYFKDGRIHLLEIGKYEKRKNHYMMVNVFEKLHAKYPDTELVIAGECSDHFHEEYYQKLSEYVREHDLQDSVKLYRNLKRDEMKKVYLDSDLFVLSSTGEPASVSVLEAMSFCVPAFSGTDNGTADYIEPDVTGEIYRDRDEKDLFEKMDKVLANRNVIPQMGEAAYRSIMEKYQFENYYREICQMMDDRREGK